MSVSNQSHRHKVDQAKTATETSGCRAPKNKPHKFRTMDSDTIPVDSPVCVCFSIFLALSLTMDGMARPLSRSCPTVLLEWFLMSSNLKTSARRLQQWRESELKGRPYRPHWMEARCWVGDNWHVFIRSVRDLCFGIWNWPDQSGNTSEEVFIICSVSFTPTWEGALLL